VGFIDFLIIFPQQIKRNFFQKKPQTKTGPLQLVRSTLPINKTAPVFSALFIVIIEGACNRRYFSIFSFSKFSLHHSLNWKFFKLFAMEPKVPVADSDLGWFNDLVGLVQPAKALREEFGAVDQESSRIDLEFELLS